ncbi:MAG: indole-3-glycerol phosphate synthase TrpC [Parafilimonas sp.]
MNILEQIISDKKKEIELKKRIIPVNAWKQMPFYTDEKISLENSLLEEGSTGIIAEFKRKSPSKGVINDKAELTQVVSAYNIHGAAGISVLTDEKYFGGLNDDLLLAREIVSVPLLRKDFIIDEYQLYEASAVGADVILLIAACLTKEQVKQFALKAKQLGLEVLLEIHNEKELEYISDEVDLVGVNNRNLKTFETDINTSLQLIDKIPKNKVAISESGISDADAIITLRKAGFKGFLIGESFMKQNNPGNAFQQFAKQLKKSL